MENTTAAGTRPLRATDNLSERQIRQMQHLRQAARETRTRPGDCLHNLCPACAGTGTRNDGSRCIHETFCPCGQCAPKQ